MTTETIDIQVDDSQLNQLIDALQSLVRGLDKTDKEAKDTAKSLDKLENEAKNATRSLDKLEKEAKNSGRGLKDLAGNLSAAFGAMKVAELGAAALTAAFDFAKEAVSRFTENNEEAAARAANLDGALNSLYLRIGEQIAQSPEFIAAQEQIIQLFSDAGDESTDLGRVIGDLVDGALWLLKGSLDAGKVVLDLWTGAVDFAAIAMDAFAITIQNIPLFFSYASTGAVKFALRLEGALVGALQFAMEKFKAFVDYVRPVLTGLGIDLSALDEITGSATAELAARQAANQALIERTQAESEALANQISSSYERVERAYNDLGGSGRQAEISIVPVDSGEEESTTSSSSRSSSSTGESTRRRGRREGPDPVYGTITDFFSFLQRGTSFLYAWGEDFQESATVNAEERERAEQEAQEEARRLAEEAAARIEAFQTGAVDAGFAFGSAALSSIVEGSDTLGLDIGQGFSETGLGFLSEQLPDLLGIAGPWGAAISGGIKLISSVVSGLFNRERKRKEREAKAAALQEFNTSTSFITTNNVGLVIGDRRAVTQQLSNFNNDTQRRAG